MSYPFLQARCYTPGPRRNPIELLVVHDMESDETIRTAEDCAQYFHNMPYDPKRGSSAHACGDSDSIIECVHDGDIAWAAPSANHNGLHFEHAGRARQSREEWLDDFGQAMLHLSAKWFADKCYEYSIPPVWLNAPDLTVGARGITSHWETTIAYNIRGGHTDPGPNFPIDWFMSLVTDEFNKLVNPNPDPPKDVVKPMFDPELGVAAFCAGPNGQGAIAVSSRGDFWNFGAPIPDTHGALLGPAGQPFWGDRRAATIQLWPGTPEFPVMWEITATDGATYHFPAPPGD